MIPNILTLTSICLRVADVKVTFSLAEKKLYFSYILFQTGPHYLWNNIKKLGWLPDPSRGWGRGGGLGEGTVTLPGKHQLVVLPVSKNTSHCANIEIKTSRTTHRLLQMYRKLSKHQQNVGLTMLGRISFKSLSFATLLLWVEDLYRASPLAPLYTWIFSPLITFPSFFVPRYRLVNTLALAGLSIMFATFG